MFAAASAAVAQGVLFPGCSAEEMKRRIDNLGPVPIEGLWQFTGDGAVIAVERSQADIEPDALPYSYNIIMVEPVDDKVVAGALIGRLKATALASSFDCTLFTDPDNPRSRTRRFTVKMTDEGHLSFVKVKSGTTVSLWRLIPYLFRVTVVKRAGRDPNLDGAIRIYPLSPSTFNGPRYL